MTLVDRAAGDDTTPTTPVCWSIDAGARRPCSTSGFEAAEKPAPKLPPAVGAKAYSNLVFLPCGGPHASGLPCSLPRPSLRDGDSDGWLAEPEPEREDGLDRR